MLITFVEREEGMSLFRKKAARGNLRRKAAASDEEEDGTEEEPSSQLPVHSALPSAIPPVSLLSFDEENEGPVFQVKRSSQSRKLAKLKKKLQKEKDENGDSEKNPPLPPPIKEEPVSEDTPSQESPIVFAPKREQKEPNREQKRDAPLHGRFPNDGSIPDAKTVFLARKQRQRAREGEVIPLDDTQVYKKEGRRLVREEDENDESDLEEEGGRFYSRKNLLAEEEESRKKVHDEFLDIEQGESDDERDEEFERWEREQIRKGVSAQQLNTLNQEQMFYEANEGLFKNGYNTVTEPEPMELDVDIIPEEDWAKRKRKGKALPKLAPAPQPLSLSDILAKLKLSIDEKESHHRERFREREKVEDHLTDCEANILRLSDLEPKLKEQYGLFQEMKSYSLDLLDCFNEKIDDIQRVEDEMHSLLRSRAEFLARRRRQDMKDQFEQCSRLAANSHQHSKPEPERMMRIAEREARRTRRRQAREKTAGGNSNHEEGTSSDDEEAPSRIASLDSDIKKIQKEGASVMEDVREEFSSISSICKRFSHWHSSEPSSFDEAYIALCIPKLISPLLRIQLLSWDPLEKPDDLTRHSWYRELLSVESGRKGSQEESSFPACLIPDTVEKVIIPKLTALLGAWDVTSSKKSQNAAACLLALVKNYPTLTAESKHMETLVQKVYSKIKETLDEDLFTPIYSKETLENPASGSKAFLDRQFWFSLKVLRNAIRFDGILSTKAVQELVIDGILNRHLVLGIQCSILKEPSALIKSRAVIEALPPDWLKSGSKSELEPFAKLLWRMGEEVQNAGGDSRRKTMKEIHSALKNIGANHKADKFASTFFR